MVLNKKVPRDLKENLIRNIAMLLIIVLSMSLVVSLCSSADCIKHTIYKMWNICNVEDGNFETSTPLSTRNLKKLSEINCDIEKSFYFDIDSEGKTLRLFSPRKRIDLPYTEKGRLPEGQNEIFLEKNFCKIHSININDLIKISGKNYKVTGIGCFPDYSYVKQTLSDVVPNDYFSVGIVSDRDWESLKGNNKTVYNYSYKLYGNTTSNDLKDEIINLKFDPDSVSDTYIKKMLESEDQSSAGGILSMFSERRYNIRINDAVDDSSIGKQAALVSGIILIVLLVYMLSVLASGTVEKERQVIGTLYALGYTKKEILSHYMKIPMIISVLGAVLGTVLGFALTDAMSLSSSSVYSYPKIIHIFPLYLVFYGLGLPTVLCYIINRAVLSKKLNLTPLEMMRGNPKKLKHFNFKLDNFSFPSKYKIRQFFRELNPNITLFFGITVSLLLLMFSVACYGSIKNYSNGITNDVNFSYMYVLRNPVTDLPKNSVVGYTRSFYVNYPLSESEMEVTLMGIDYENPYFPFAPYLDNATDKVYISSSARIKFGYKTGDRIVFKDNSEDKLYAFEIAGEVKYGNGLYFFMNIDAMRKYFVQSYFNAENLKKGERIPKNDDFYYNTVFSDKKLSFKHNMMLSETVKSDMKKGADKFITLMWGMIILLIGVSVIIFVSVMYLLMKLEIDRSNFSISLLKALGYDEKTVNSFYLDSAFYITLVSAIIGMPICKKIIDILYPFCISNVNAGFEASISPIQYVFIIILIFASYFVTRKILTMYLKKADVTEILKSRE